MAAFVGTDVFLVVRPVDPWPWKNPVDILALPREIAILDETDVEISLDHDDPAVRCFAESFLRRMPVLLMTPSGSIPMVVTDCSPYEHGKPSSLKTTAIGSPWEADYRYRVRLRKVDRQHSSSGTA